MHASYTLAAPLRAGRQFSVYCMQAVKFASRYEPRSTQTAVPHHPGVVVGESVVGWQGTALMMGQHRSITLLAAVPLEVPLSSVWYDAMGVPV